MNQAGSVLSGWRRSSAWSRTWLQKRSTTSSRLWVGTWHKAAILSTLPLHASIWHVGLAQTLNKVCMCLSTFLSSVLWCCWLGDRKGIRPVNNWVVGVPAWLSVWSEVQTCIWPSWCHCHSLSLASVKSWLVLPFWYRLTWVVPDKRPLNECVDWVELLVLS